MLQLTDHAIMEFEKKHRDDLHKLQAFVQLRAVLAPCIETLLLLDRFYYLLEQVGITTYKSCYLVLGYKFVYLYLECKKAFHNMMVYCILEIYDADLPTTMY